MKKNEGRSARRPRAGWAAVEQLESRQLLALITWDGGGDGTTLSQAANWAGDVTPGPADDAVVDIGGTPTIAHASGTFSALSLTIAEKVGSPLLLEDARMIAQDREVFRSGAGSTDPGDPQTHPCRAQASDQVLSSCAAPADAVTQPLLDAFVNRQVAVITYQDQHSNLTVREIELQYLYYNVSVWYALVWDRLRDNVRFFRIDRIKNIQLLSEQFRLRRDDQFLTAGEPDAKAL